MASDVKSLKSLKDTAAASKGTAIPSAPNTPTAPEKEKKVKKEKAPADPNAAPVERKNNLPKKEKSPEKAKKEADTDAAIKAFLTGKPEGALTEEILDAIYEVKDMTDEDKSEESRFIRQRCRAMNCAVTRVENSRKVKYSLPK